MIRPLIWSVAPGSSLGEGAEKRRRTDIRPVGTITAGFLISSFVTIGSLSLIGSAIGVLLVPTMLRLVAIAAIFVGLVAVDVASVRTRDLCRLTWRRQTRKNLIYRFGPRTGTFLWGLDTGTVVTTLRVSATSWAMLALAVFHLAPWWTGLAYGLGFAMPLAFVIAVPRWRGPAPDGSDREPQWISGLLMRTRWIVQLVGFLLLVACTVAVIVKIVVAWT